MINDLVNTNKLRSGELKDLIPEFYELSDVVENNPWHNYENVFDHTLKVMDSMVGLLNNSNSVVKEYFNKIVGKYTRHELLLVVVLLHDLGKKETLVVENGIAKCPGHEHAALDRTKIILSRFELPPEDQERVLSIISNHSAIHKIMNLAENDYNVAIAELKQNNSDIYLDLIFLGCADTKPGYLSTTDPVEYKLRMDRYYFLIDNFPPKAGQPLAETV